MMGPASTRAATLPAGRVSVVMPAYNACATLEASMQSVLTQGHRDLELLVVDDRSDDDTWEIALEAGHADPRVKPIRLAANAGVAAARNAGLEAAAGEFIAFLDSDDRWYPGKLEAQLASMMQTGTLASYTAYERVTGQGDVLSWVRPPPRVDHAGMLKGNCIGNLTGMYARSLGEMRFERTGHEDYVFWLRAVKLAGVAVCAGYPGPLASYLVRPGSLSANKLRAAHWQWSIYRDVEGMGPLASAWYFAHYAGNALAKRI